MPGLSRLFLIFTFIIVFAGSVRGGAFVGHIVSFDFDTGAPPLHPTMPLPITQTVGNVTADFTGRFSVQSHDTTSYNLPNFSGNYLVPADAFSPSLQISFNAPLIALFFDFATADFGLDKNTTLKLTAYHGNRAVGSATEQAVGEGFGLGHLAFQSGESSTFDLVDIQILPGAGSDFLADNFTVWALPPAALPEPATVFLVLTGTVAVALMRR